MAFQRFGNYLLTDSGRNFCMYSALAVGTSVYCIKTLPHTFFLSKYEEVIHLYRHGMSVPVPQELKERFNKAVDLIGIPEKQRKLSKPFMVYGFDVYHAGTAQSKYGGIIGLPVNFTYTDTDKIDKHLITVNNASVPWELDEGQQLLQSMVLSENAQLYAIARELKMVHSAKFIFDTIYTMAGFFMCFGISMALNRKLNLIARPRQLRFMMYGIVAAFSFGNYALAKDFTQVHYEQNIDKFLKEKDPIFVEGAKDFYQKLLLRNRALRKLLGKAGESHYSILGNENFFLRQKHVPLIHRKEFFEDKRVEEGNLPQ